MRSSFQKSLFWSLMEQGGSKIALLIIQVVLARLLTPEDFGLLAILLVFTTIADSIAQSGLGSALIQRTNLKKEDFSTAFWMALAISLITYLVLFCSAPLLATFFRMVNLEAFLRVLSVAVIFNAISSIQRSYLQREMNFAALFKCNVFAVCVSGTIGVAIAILGGGAWALVSQVVLQAVISFVLLLIIVPCKITANFELKVAKELLRYGWKICVTGILNVLYMGTSELIIGRYCTTYDLGLFSQGRKWPNAAIGILSGALQNVLFPKLSLLKDDHKAFLSSVRLCLSVGNFIIVPLSLFFAVAASPIIELLLGSQWQASVPIFQLLCCSNCLLITQIVNLRAYMALGDSAVYLKLQIVKVLIGIGLIGGSAAIFHDIYIVAIVNAAVVVINILVIDLQPSKRLIGYSRWEQVKDFLPTALLSIAAACITNLLPLFTSFQSVSLLGIEIIVFFGSYIVLARLFNINAGKISFRLMVDFLTKIRRKRPTD